MEKLFIVHLGYYDDLSNGVYESHTNIFVVAQDFEEAKVKAKGLTVFQTNKMHIDGIQMVEAVDGYLIQLTKNPTIQSSIITNYNFRELSPKNKKT